MKVVGYVRQLLHIEDCFRLRYRVDVIYLNRNTCPGHDIVLRLIDRVSGAFCFVMKLGV